MTDFCNGGSAFDVDVGVLGSIPGCSKKGVFPLRTPIGGREVVIKCGPQSKERQITSYFRAKTDDSCHLLTIQYHE